MYYLASYLKDEVLNYQTLDILVKGSIPEDCDTLVITTPKKDFDELTTNEITKYINNGGKILWLNASYSEQKDLPNVNKILALYGINPIWSWICIWNRYSRTAFRICKLYSWRFRFNRYSKKLTDAVLLNATKINVNTDELTNLGVTEQAIISTSSTSYFRKNVSNTASGTDGDEQGGFTVGGIFTKKISNGTEEKWRWKQVKTIVKKML